MRVEPMTTYALVALVQKAVGDVQIAGIAGNVGRTTQHSRSEKHVLNAIIRVQHLRHPVRTSRNEAVRCTHQQVFRALKM